MLKILEKSENLKSSGRKYSSGTMQKKKSFLDEIMKRKLVLSCLVFLNIQFLAVVYKLGR